jgi:predicted LPLAT superfamily acyltransferase
VSESRWNRAREFGTLRSLRAFAAVLRRIPRPIGRCIVWVVGFYYSIRGRAARRASRAYLECVAASAEGRAALGQPVDGGAVRRHVIEFAIALYDRILVWGGALDSMQLEHDGSGEAFDLAKTGRGALLLGAHLGNVEMLWLISKRHRLPVNVVAYFDNAAMVNAFLESLDPERSVRVIGLDPGSVGAAFEIRACLERGELVVILADRLPPGHGGRVAEAAFLGRPAPFPLAPFLLAVTLGCPVVFTLCLRTADASYRTVLRPLSDGGRIPRAEREKAARELLERYVGMLERWCLRYPWQWFNFYDFWSGSSSSGDSSNREDRA